MFSIAVRSFKFTALQFYGHHMWLGKRTPPLCVILYSWFFTFTASIWGRGGAPVLDADLAVWLLIVCIFLCRDVDLVIV